MSYKIFVQEPSVHGRRGIFRCEIERPNGGALIAWGYSPQEAFRRAYQNEMPHEYPEADRRIIDAARDWFGSGSKKAFWIIPTPGVPWKVIV